MPPGRWQNYQDDASGCAGICSSTIEGRDSFLGARQSVRRGGGPPREPQHDSTSKLLELPVSDRRGRARDGLRGAAAQLGRGGGRVADRPHVDGQSSHTTSG
jgi:hypothetical protein